MIPIKIWDIYVGSGRFLVRAYTEDEAIKLAREASKPYWSSKTNIEDLPAGIQTDLSLDGPPEVLDIDYS
jgi:hypothetical protein